jgi:UDP-glucose-4-epimerase GalE
MVLVAGGAGYIGSHTVKRLRADGIGHVVVDDLSRGNRQSVGESPFFRADLCDREALRAVFKQHQVTSVLHLAGAIEVGESVLDPATFYHRNVFATWNLLETMREFGVRTIVFSSTAAVYGEPQKTPIPEDHPTNPSSPYGDTKLAVERMLLAYDAAYEIRSVRLRYFNAAGADQDGELGEAHRPETHLVPRAILAALGRGTFSVFGEDYPTPDGTAVRDYVHVDDLADAHARALEHVATGGISCVYNLGSGRGYSVREVVEMVRQVHRDEFVVGRGPRREGDPAVLVADCSAIIRDWGWKPRNSDLDTVVQTAYRWLKDHPNGYSDARSN